MTTTPLAHVRDDMQALAAELWAEAHAANRAAQQAKIDGGDVVPLIAHGRQMTALAQRADGLHRQVCGLVGGCGHSHDGDWLTVVPEQREGR